MSGVGEALAYSVPPSVVGGLAWWQSRQNAKQLRTENGLSVGQLADRNEAERIMLNVIPEHRTAAEQAYVEAYLKQGRNVGHEGQEPGPVRADPLLRTRPARAPLAEALEPAAQPPAPRPPVDTSPSD